MSGKAAEPGNVGEFHNCQGNVRKLTKSHGSARENSCQGKLFIAYFMFGLMPVFMFACMFIMQLNVCKHNLECCKESDFTAPGE